MVARRRHGPFIATLEHRRFVEFANAVRQNRYIGLCFGAAGVGKTLSARRYANWDRANPTALMSYRASKAAARRIDAALVASRTVFYTPSVSVTPATLRRDLNALLTTANTSIGLTLGQDPDTDQDHIELVIIDEADRLSHAALECARDLFDRADFGLILIGMPGIEKRMARYPQFYSRVGFAHHFHPLQGKDLSFVTAHHCRKVCSGAGAGTPNAKAIATIARITGGNFRLLHRLLVQIERVLKINKLTAITVDVIDAARSMLVIGAT
jgi:DNA transposition AAA+ family ATPase